MGFADADAAERDENFVPTDRELIAAFREWKDAYRNAAPYVDGDGYMDPDNEEAVKTTNAVRAAEVRVEARLKALGYQTVVFSLRMVSYENNKNPELFPNGHYYY